MADDDRDDTTAGPGKEEKEDPRLSKVLKKLFAAGVSGAMLSEEAIRGYLGDIKLPKDLLNLVVQGAQKSKDEITQRASREIVNLVRKIDIVREVSRFAEEHKFKITAEIEVTRKNKDGDQGKNRKPVVVINDKDSDSDEDDV